jgi:hypothetical protein
LVVAFGVAVATVGPCRGAAQESFRTSLTATVSRLPESDSVTVARGEVERAAEAAPDAAASARLILRCRRVTLHWAPLPGARRYTIYVSVDGRDGWRPLSSRNACGESRVTEATTVVDVEPTTGGTTVVRRLCYRVEAFDRAGADARLIATTTSVPVELP